MPLKATQALKIMREHDCEMTLASLYAWIRSTKYPCPFGVYTQGVRGSSPFASTKKILRAATVLRIFVLPLRLLFVGGMMLISKPKPR